MSGRAARGRCALSRWPGQSPRQQRDKPCQEPLPLVLGEGRAGDGRVAGEAACSGSPLLGTAQRGARGRGSVARQPRVWTHFPPAQSFCANEIREDTGKVLWQDTLKNPATRRSRSPFDPGASPSAGSTVPGACARQQVAVETKAVLASDSSEIAICQEPLERPKVNESVLESEGYHPR